MIVKNRGNLYLAQKDKYQDMRQMLNYALKYNITFIHFVFLSSLELCKMRNHNVKWKYITEPQFSGNIQEHHKNPYNFNMLPNLVTFSATHRTKLMLFFC